MVWFNFKDSIFTGNYYNSFHMKGSGFYVDNCTFSNEDLDKVISKEKYDSLYNKFGPSLKVKL